jgi:hypothetical protein
MFVTAHGFLDPGAPTISMAESVSCVLDAMGSLANTVVCVLISGRRAAHSGNRTDRAARARFTNSGREGDLKPFRPDTRVLG